MTPHLGHRERFRKEPDWRRRRKMMKMWRRRKKNNNKMKKMRSRSRLLTVRTTVLTVHLCPRRNQNQTRSPT